FDNNLSDAIQTAAWFLSSLKDDKLTSENTARVVAFWDRCIVWATTQSIPPGKVLAGLSSLAWALSDAVGRNRELLLAVAPFVGAHNTDAFLEELLRLVEVSPAEVSNIVAKLLETYQPAFDYRDYVRSLIERLAELGQRAAALEFCVKLR